MGGGPLRCPVAGVGVVGIQMGRSHGMGAIGLLVVGPVVPMILRLVVASSICWMVVSRIGHRLVVAVAWFWPLVVMVVRSQGSSSGSKTSDS